MKVVIYIILYYIIINQLQIFSQIPQSVKKHTLEPKIKCQEKTKDRHENIMSNLYTSPISELSRRLSASRFRSTRSFRSLFSPKSRDKLLFIPGILLILTLPSYKVLFILKKDYFQLPPLRY